MHSRMTNTELRDHYSKEATTTRAAEELAARTGKVIETRRSSAYLLRQVWYFEQEIAAELSGVVGERHRLSKVA